jgi:hypothetical protein
VYDPGVAQVFSGLAPNTLYTFNAKARDSALDDGEKLELQGLLRRERPPLSERK